VIRTFQGYTEVVLDNGTHLLGSQERFVQTGVGWVLRELSNSDEECVIGFVEANLDRFSRQALKNATKYLPPEVAEHLPQTHPSSTTRSRRRS
jgi:3-methyladenine DNA glycosylase AlkD